MHKQVSSLEELLKLTVRNGDCIIFMGARGGMVHEYGIIKTRFGKTTAQRTAFLFANGSIPDGYDVCHRCDNPRCINPDHLFAASHADNMADMRSKGRARYGVRHMTAENVAKVKQLRSSGATHRAIAGHLGISLPSVRKTLAGPI